MSIVEPDDWYLVTINANWGKGYLFYNDSPPWRAGIEFSAQPIGVKQKYLKQIRREFPDAVVHPCPTI